MIEANFESLIGKTCVMTGATGVLGNSICEILAKAGVNLAVLGLLEEEAQAQADGLSGKYGIKAIGIGCNVLKKEDIESANERIIAEFGKIDFLINGAGGNSPKATTKIEQIEPSGEILWDDSFYGLAEEGFKQVFDLNFQGTLLPTMVFTKGMVERGQGVVLNISSMNAFKPLTKIPAYSAAKSAINNFTEWLAVHLGKTGVRVNAIAPGFFLTNQNRFLLTEEQTGELTPRGQRIISSTPMGKFGEPDDMGGTVLFLLSDLSEFITGIVIPVDGGYSAFGGV